MATLDSVHLDLADLDLAILELVRPKLAQRQRAMLRPGFQVHYRR